MVDRVTKTAVIVGMTSEATIAKSFGCQVIVGAGNALQLRISIEDAVSKGVNQLLSFGVAGGCNPAYQAGDIIYGNYVLDSKTKIFCNFQFYFKCQHPRLGAFVSTNTPISTSAQKAQLHYDGADAVDMESVVVAKIAAAHAIPFGVIRAISDPAGVSLPSAATEALDTSGNVDLLSVFRSLIRDPAQITALISLGFDSQKAFSNLRKVSETIGKLT